MMQRPADIRRAYDSHIRNGLVIGAAATAVMAWTTMPAYAYLDPGSASFVLQGLVGTIAASAAAIGGYWHRIKTVFRRGQRKHDQHD